MSNLPPIGFGTGQLKGNEAYNAVSAALACGFRLVDTGAIYDNEREVGAAISASLIPREEITVITKGAHNEDEHGYEQVIAGFEASLGRLALPRIEGISYVDYYLIHWPTNPGARVESWRAMEDIRRSGRARAIGVSNYGVHHLKELEDTAIQPSVNQIEFHPYIYAEQKEILDFCKKSKIEVIGYSTFADGQSDRDPVVSDIAKRHGKHPLQVLTRWSMQHGVAPLVRSSSPEHIAANHQIEDFKLTHEDMLALDSLRGKRLFRDPNKLA